MANKKDDAKLKCSFCGKTQQQVRKLIAGPNVYICDQCIELCSEILDEELGISEKVYAFGEKIEQELKERFEKIDANAEYNQMKVIAAMQKNRVKIGRAHV